MSPELYLLEQFYIKVMSWHNRKPCGKTTRSKQQYQKVTSNAFSPTNTSEIQHKYLWNPTNTQNMWSCFEIKLKIQPNNCELNENQTVSVLFLYILHISLVVSLRHTKKTHSGGKHRNADALWAINALNSSCCALYTHIWGTFHFPLYVLSEMSYRC